jgi:hypothetical protein
MTLLVKFVLSLYTRVPQRSNLFCLPQKIFLFQGPLLHIFYIKISILIRCNLIPLPELEDILEVITETNVDAKRLCHPYGNLAPACSLGAVLQLGGSSHTV